MSPSQAGSPVAVAVAVADRGRTRSPTPSRSRSRSRSGTPPHESSKIVVEKLTRNVTEAHIREIFGKYGTIAEVTMPMNRTFNLNQGIAYIVYDTAVAAEDAISHLHEGQLDGEVLDVSIVLPRRTFSRSPPPAHRRGGERFVNGNGNGGYGNYRDRDRDRDNRGYRHPSEDRFDNPRQRRDRSQSRDRYSHQQRPPNRDFRPNNGYRRRSWSRSSRSMSRSGPRSRNVRRRSRSRSYSSRSRSRSPGPRRQISPNGRANPQPAMNRRRSTSFSSRGSYRSPSRSPVRGHGPNQPVRRGGGR